MEDFARSGDIHVDYLKLLGMKNGMSIYDLACGCGKTAQALKRAGWSGNYVGADIIKRFTDHLVQSYPEYKAFVHKDNTIAADDNSLDIIFSNSLFTHLQHEEIYLYIKDSYRALKSNGRLIFSFLEYSNSRHKEIFQSRVEMILRSINPDHLDTFLHKDFIVMWASDARFNRNVSFIDGDIELSSCGH
jgi:ubiquinone/menaquinone biosynthesis C-methylase UbiE